MIKYWERWFNLGFYILGKCFIWVLFLVFKVLSLNCMLILEILKNESYIVEFIKCSILKFKIY